MNRNYNVQVSFRGADALTVGFTEDEMTSLGDMLKTLGLLNYRLSRMIRDVCVWAASDDAPCTLEHIGIYNASVAADMKLAAWARAVVLSAADAGATTEKQPNVVFQKHAKRALLWALSKYDEVQKLQQDDPAVRFLVDRCSLTHRHEDVVKISDMHAAFELWDIENNGGQKAMAIKTLGKRLRAIGLPQVLSGQNNIRAWRGVVLNSI